MSGLTRKQRDLLDFIVAYMAQRRIAPSYDEMKEGIGLKSKSGVYELVKLLEARGYVRRPHGRARAIEIVPEAERASAIYRNAQKQPSDTPSADTALLAVLRAHQVAWLKRAALQQGMTPIGLLRELFNDVIAASAEEPTRGRRIEA